MKNSLGRTVPNQGEGVDASVPFVGAFATPAAGRRYAPPLKYRFPGTTKRIASLEDVFRAIPVRNGMTLSFHHHFRNGDKVLNLVLETAAKLDLKDLRIAVSSIFPVHEPLIGHINRGDRLGLGHQLHVRSGGARYQPRHPRQSRHDADPRRKGPCH